MASETRGIVARAAAVLAGITTAGGYVHDLSATGRVRIGIPLPGAGPTPCAWLWIDTLRAGYSEELGSWRQDLALGIHVRVPASNGSTDERQLIAVDALDDVVTALRGDRTLAGLVLDSVLVGSAFAGEEAGIPGCAIVEARYECWWIATRAEGV